MKKQWNTVLLLVLALIVVIFSVLNVDPVAINLGFKIIQVPLAIMLIGTLLLGVLMAAILSTTIILQNKNEYKKLEQRLQESKKHSETEKEYIRQQHQEKMQKLQENNENKEAEIRELKRRIQNMKTSNTAGYKN